MVEQAIYGLSKFLQNVSYVRQETSKGVPLYVVQEILDLRNCNERQPQRPSWLERIISKLIIGFNY